ncbi:MAG: hypothetical protein IJX71_02930, partial [Oscillospiraceae bacterium]|nr:hypothetical protein [Oscillospiraceae bacterium]
MAATLEGFYEYLQPPETDYTKLSLWLEAAKVKARAAGIPEYRNNSLYYLFIYSFAAMYYDNRGMAFSCSYQG